MARESMGGIPCLCCGREVPVKKSDKGALSVSCSWCDLSAYAKEGTEAHRRIVAALPKQNTTREVEAPAPVNVPGPATAPAAPKFKPAFA